MHLNQLSNGGIVYANQTVQIRWKQSAQTVFQPRKLMTLTGNTDTLALILVA